MATAQALRPGTTGLLPFWSSRLFDWWGAGTTVPALLVIPEFLWELSLGIYAAIWGFRKDAPILSARRTTASQTDAA